LKRKAEESLRNLLVGAVLVLLAVSLVVWLVRGGYLWFVPQRLAVVRIEGHFVYPGRELINRSGLRLDHPLTPRDLALARQSLEELPLLERARMRWRRGGLTISVRELLPVALVKVSGAYYLLLEDGRVIPREAAEGREAVLARLRTVPTLVLSDPLQKEDSVLLSKAQRALAAAVAFGRPVARYLRLTEQGELVLELKDGSRIELGSQADGLELRVVRGIEVWRALHSRSRGGPLSIDLATSEGVAYVKLERS